jgi:bud site selection protein 20
LKSKSDTLLNQDVDFDQPGMAQFYCLHCARYFINQQALDDHFKTKVHKRRMKALQDDPYTQEEAEIAAGHGSFIKKPEKRKIDQQPTKEEFAEGKRVKMDYFTPQELESAKKKKKRKSNNNNNVSDSKEMDIDNRE